MQARHCGTSSECGRWWGEKRDVPTLDRESNVVNQSRPSDNEHVRADLLHPIFCPTRNDRLDNCDVQWDLGRLEFDVEFGAGGFRGSCSSCGGLRTGQRNGFCRGLKESSSGDEGSRDSFWGGWGGRDRGISDDGGEEMACARFHSVRLWHALGIQLLEWGC